jgi:phage-related protein
MLAFKIREGTKLDIFALGTEGNNLLYEKEFYNTLDEKVVQKMEARLTYLAQNAPRFSNDEIVKKLDRNIYEVRARFGKVFPRLLFFFYDGKIVITHGFKKKTDKTPQAEIDRANRLRGEFLAS